MHHCEFLKSVGNFSQRFTVHPSPNVKTHMSIIALSSNAAKNPTCNGNPLTTENELIRISRMPSPPGVNPQIAEQKPITPYKIETLNDKW